MIHKGFFGSASFERLRTNIPPDTIPEETSREWINRGFVGLGKAYSIVTFLKGNLQVMYNFLHKEKGPLPK